MTNEPSGDHGVGQQSRRFITFIAILFILIGQVFLLPSKQAAAVPFMLVMTVLGILLFLWGQTVSPSNRVARFIDHWRIPPILVKIIPAVALSLITSAGAQMFERLDYKNYVPILTLWFFAGACYLAAFFPSVNVLEKLKTLVKNHWREAAIVVAVTFLGFALRFFKLGTLPRIVNGDEGWMAVTALTVDVHPWANPFALWENFGALYLQATNAVFGLFGVNAFSLRLLPAISGVLAIPAIYLLGRQIGNHRIGLIAAILLATSHTHVHFSRTAAVGYTHGTWLVPFELYFLFSGLIKRKPWRAALGGMLLGFHFSIYLTSQIVTALVFVYMLIGIFVFRKQLKDFFRVMAAFWGGLIIILFPHAVYFANHPNEFFSRLSQDGTFQSGWLASTMAATGQSSVQILAERVLHAFMSLIYYPAFDFYGSNIPMLTLFTSALFLLGLGICLWKTARPGILLLNGYFWATTLSVGIFSIPPSADSYRMLITFPAALIMAAIALDFAMNSMGFGWERWKRGYLVLVSLLLSSVVLFNIWVYFIDFVGQCRYGIDNPQTRYYSYLGTYLADLDPSAPVYLLSDDSFPWVSNLTVEFLAGRRPINSTNDAIDTLSLVPGDVIIASPNRIDELAAWVRLHPGGDSELLFDCTNPILRIYQVPVSGIQR